MPGTSRLERAFRIVIPVTGVVILLFWQLITWRMTGGLLLPIILSACWLRHMPARRYALCGLLALFIAAPFNPYDISFMVRPGRPHFVRLVMGLPGPELVREAREGKVLLGGCVVMGFEPRYVWVW
jgi:hypothetical protein